MTQQTKIIITKTLLSLPEHPTFHHPIPKRSTSQRPVLKRDIRQNTTIIKTHTYIILIPNYCNTQSDDPLGTFRGHVPSSKTLVGISVWDVGCPCFAVCADISIWSAKCADLVDGLCVVRVWLIVVFGRLKWEFFFGLVRFLVFDVFINVCSDGIVFSFFVNDV